MKADTFSRELSRDLAKAQDERLAGDYSFKSEITREAAENAVIRAENFIQTLKEYLIEEKFLEK